MATPVASQGSIVRIGLTTVILGAIALASVVSSGLLLYQSMNRTSEGPSSKESLDLMGEHVWFQRAYGWAEAGIIVVNSGEKNVTLQKIAVCGVESEWSDIYYWRSENGPVSSELVPTDTILYGDVYDVSLGGTTRTLQQANDKLILLTGQTIVLYIRDPGNIIATNIPEKAIITVFTQNNLYYKEVSVEAPSTSGGTEQVTISKIAWSWSDTASARTFTLVVNNTGTRDVTMNRIEVNYGTNGVTQPTTLPLILRVSTGMVLTVGYAYTNGTNYDISVVVATGYKFTNNYDGGQNAG